MTSGRPPTGGAPRAELSSTARPTCQRLSPGQPTCDGGGRQAAMELGLGLCLGQLDRAQMPQADPLPQSLLDWSGGGATTRPGARGGTRTFTGGLPVGHTQGSPAGTWEIEPFFPSFLGLLPIPLLISLQGSPLPPSMRLWTHWIPSEMQLHLKSFFSPLPSTLNNPLSPPKLPSHLSFLLGSSPPLIPPYPPSCSFPSWHCQRRL